MEINRPGVNSLSPSQQELLEKARQQLHERMLNGGFSGSDVKRIITALRNHPDMSTEVLQLIHQEAQQLAPGESLINFDWD